MAENQPNDTNSVGMILIKTKLKYGLQEIAITLRKMVGPEGLEPSTNGL